MKPVECSELWSSVLLQVRSRIPDERFEMWLKDTRLAEVSDESCTIQVPNRFAREYVSSRLGQILESGVQEVTGKKFALKFQVAPGAVEGVGAESSVPRSPCHAPPAGSAAGVISPLRKDMTFENFVVGPCSRIAHAAANAIAEGETNYNPFFVYGGTGLGKTHLLQALCHSVARRNCDCRVYYLNCDTFVYDFCAAVSHSRRCGFRSRFRELDVLAVDDVNLLAKKPGTQKEFLSIFNEMETRHKQVFLGSMTHPKMIDGLQDGLRSRFMSGIVVQLEKPAYPTRLGILKKLLGRQTQNLPESHLETVARSLTTSVREIVGVANRLAAEVKLSSTPLSQGQIEKILSEFLARPHESLGIRDIESAVCSAFKTTPEALKSDRRSRGVALPRQVAMYLARQMLGLSYQEIGNFFGGKDHTTVLSSERRVLWLIERDPETRLMIARLSAQLRPTE